MDRPSSFRKAFFMKRSHRVVVFGSVVALGIGGTQLAFGAGGGSTPSSLVPIVPCRLMDTRPGADNVGPRSTPLQPGETYTTPVWDTNGACTIPSTATAVAANVTSVNGNANSYLTLFPADAAAPLSSNLNWGPGSPPDPEQDRRQALVRRQALDVQHGRLGRRDRRRRRLLRPVAERLRRQWRQGRHGSDRTSGPSRPRRSQGRTRAPPERPARPDLPVPRATRVTPAWRRRCRRHGRCRRRGRRHRTSGSGRPEGRQG